MEHRHDGESLWALRPRPVGPLVPYIDPFLQFLQEQGYKREVIGDQAQEIAKSDDHATRFLKPRKELRSRGGQCAAVRRLLDFLRELGVISQAQSQGDPSPIQVAIDLYARSLRQDQGLSRATCRQYVPFIEQFLKDRFGAGPLELSTLNAADAIAFIRSQPVRPSPARAKCATIALRSFLRYLRFRGEIGIDLAAAVPTVPNWSMTGIPRAIATDHVRAVLKSCSRGTAVGRRDYAILLLLARLGLRSSEIASLTLDSIDWKTSCITVRGKGDDTSQLPLPSDVGEAIARYLQHGRPQSDCRQLFLRSRAPVRGFGSATSIGSVVYAAVTRAGIETCHRGTHQFRHALACEMLRNGASLSEIGSLLRHRRTKTTSIYAKVDFTALRPLSLPWPGDAT